jgi:hypothetical protein
VVETSYRRLAGLVTLLLVVQGEGLWAQDPSKSASEQVGAFRVPAAPLVACDPYFSIWSQAPHLTDVNTTHWTGKPHRLVSLIRIDGRNYRLMGAEPADTPAMKQSSLTISPTRTTYQFEDGGLAVELEFMTPALPDDIDVLSRPITYVSYSVRAMDGKEHDTAIYFAASGELTVNTPRQRVVSSSEVFGDVAAVKIGSEDQLVLGRKGDDLRIDWGYLYVAAERGQLAAQAIGNPSELASEFVSRKPLTDGDAKTSAQSADQVAGAIVLDAKSVGAAPVHRWLILAYDDLYSIEYMRAKLRPYWRRNGLDASGLLREAARDYPKLAERCRAFDRELMADLERAGGEEYANLAALAYRQCFAAGKFVADANGQPLQFCKENHSNGCIGTSDVFYPMSPQFLLFGPSLAKSFVVPFMNYAASDRWKFPFAPHDLGTYPKANGQVYGGGEHSERNQMPVEECGNLLILMAAIARVEGNADFAGQYWPQLTQWAEYLKEKGFDPDNQLCTDDFAGHLAHNVNLSAKAICGLGAYAQLCAMRGDQQDADEYRAAAEEFAARWIAEADDGDHFRLAFDKPGSWSQKYNLVWDRVLDLNLFPDEMLRKEMAHYRRIQNRYGLPLDNRKEYTKLDWILWTATLTQDQNDFQALVEPVCRFLAETPNRVPMTDWYQTVSGRRQGFTARPVVGGVFMRMLYDDDVWRKWAARDTTKAVCYAAMPRPPKLVVRVAAADTDAAEWRYTTERPEGNWMATDYDDSSWRQGKSGFGTRRTPGARVGTAWNTPDIWLRRTFDLERGSNSAIQLSVHHDEDAEIYINGALARRMQGNTTGYEQFAIHPAALDAIKPSGNVFAVHCRQTIGGQYIDVGLVVVEPAEQ